MKEIRAFFNNVCLAFITILSVFFVSCLVPVLPRPHPPWLRVVRIW